MKLLVFGHVPPPHHGQAVMVELMLRGLGGDMPQSPPVEYLEGCTGKQGTNMDPPKQSEEAMQLLHGVKQISQIDDKGRDVRPARPVIWDVGF